MEQLPYGLWTDYLYSLLTTAPKCDPDLKLFHRSHYTEVMDKRNSDVNCDRFFFTFFILLVSVWGKGKGCTVLCHRNRLQGAFESSLVTC